MKLVICVLFFVLAVIAEKEVFDSNTKDATAILTEKLWTQIKKRLKDYGYTDTELDHLDRELDDEQCIYSFKNGSIIRTHDSIEAGATFINSQIGISKEDCLTECCSYDNCNVAVFKEKDNDHSCYLFDCGTPNICKFTNHTGYTVIELPSRTTSDKELEKHEYDLEQLAEVPTTTTSTTTTTTTVATTTKATPEPQPQQPVSLFGKCEQHKDCAGSWSQCLGGYCVCKDGYHEQEGTCRKDCSKFEFECHNTGQPLVYPQCVAIYNKCDGIKLCKDGSDEEDCNMNEDKFNNRYNPQLVNQPAVASVQQPGAMSSAVQSPQSAVNLRPAQHQQANSQQLANIPYQPIPQNSGQVYGDTGQQYGQLSAQLQNMNNHLPLESGGLPQQTAQYQVPAQQLNSPPLWGQQPQHVLHNAYNPAQSVPARQGQSQWNEQAQIPMQPSYNTASVQQSYPQPPNYNAAPHPQQPVQVISHTAKTPSYESPYEAETPVESPRVKGRPLGAVGREGAVGGYPHQKPQKPISHVSDKQNEGKPQSTTTQSSAGSAFLSHSKVNRLQKNRGWIEQKQPASETTPRPELRPEQSAGFPDEYYKQFNQPYDSNRHGQYGEYSRNRGIYNGGYLSDANGYIPENEGYGRGNGYDLGTGTLYGGNLPKNRLTSGGRGQYLDYDQYFADGMLNGLDPNLAYDYYPLDTGKKVNHLKQRPINYGKNKNSNVDDDNEDGGENIPTKQEGPGLQNGNSAALVNSKEVSASEADDSSSSDATKSDDKQDKNIKLINSDAGKVNAAANTSVGEKKEGQIISSNKSVSDAANPNTHKVEDNSLEKNSNDVKVSDKEKTSKSSSDVASVGGLVQVVLSEEDGVQMESREGSGHLLAGFYQSNKGAVVALSLGLCITAMLLIFIGCRLRNVKKHLRRGRPLNSNEADYLINGMYL